LGQSPEAKRNQSHPLRHFNKVQGTRGQGDTGIRVKSQR
jgi:hypothetical protein